MHVCFVALRAYPELSGSRQLHHVGGAEVQQILIARGLVVRGHRVSFVTLDHGQPDAQTFDGIAVYRSYREGGVPFVRVLAHAARVWSALGRVGADVYYHRTSDPVLGVVAAFCRRHRRPFVFGTGSDADVAAHLSHCPTRRERWPYLYGLRRASRIVTQTTSQQRALRKNHQLASVIIRNAVNVPSTVADDLTDDQVDVPRMLWVGRFAPYKRLPLLLDLAERCREIDFDVIGDGLLECKAVHVLRERALKLSNVHMHGALPHAETLAHYHRATALLCTSHEEGFPNTFLEAWARCKPVVTTFDPDGIVAAHGLGICATDLDSLAKATRSVCFDPQLRRRMGEAAYQYCRRHHGIDIVVDAYEQLFIELAGRRSLTGLHGSRGQTPPPVADRHHPGLP